MRVSRLVLLGLFGYFVLLTISAEPDPGPESGPDLQGGRGQNRGKNKGGRRNRNRNPSNCPRKNRNRGKTLGKSRSDGPAAATPPPVMTFISDLPLRPSTPEELLLRDVFDKYSADARAGIDSRNTVDVDIQYTLLRIQGLDERTQVLTTTGLVITEWVDDRLLWDPERYNNLTDIVVPPHYVWLPELALMNGAEQMVNDFDRMGVLVSHDGKLHWEPGGIFTTTCDIDITFFPFDLQRCEIVVGAWAYYSQKMKLLNSSSEIKLHDYTENGEWEILNTRVIWNETILPCCPDISYTFVSSVLHLKRRTSYYFVNIVAPCFMLSVLVLMSFCLPPEAGEKISCGISVLLAFTVFLLMVSESVPRTSLQLPIIAIYLTCTMILGTTSTCLSILVLNVHHSHKAGPVPKYVRLIILTHLARLLCINTNHHTVRIRPRKRNKRNALKGTRLQRFYANKGSSIESLFEILATQGLLNSGLSAQRQTHAHNEQSPSSPETAPVHGAIGTPTDFCIAESSKTNLSEKTSQEEITIVRDWNDVTCVLDRLFFCIVLTAMITSTVFTLGAPYFPP